MYILLPTFTKANLISLNNACQPDYRSHFNTWQTGHITVLLCSCPYMVRLPAQLTLLLNKSIWGVLWVT